jgi:3-oxoacyl-[acyl-carrier protein] reductase
MNLQNARILVTGGSSGIGKATAQLLAAHGAKVVITGRDQAKLNQVATEINCIPFALEMTDYDSFENHSKEIVQLLGGGIDVLINNAGIGEFATLETLTIQQFESVFSTNVFGLAMLTQQVVKYFIAQNKGNIINIASTAGKKGFAYGTVYASSKFALRGMTECWQAELRKNNVRVMLVNPSEVTTAFNQADRAEKEEVANKLRAEEIAHSIKAVLEMDDRGFIPELTVWATNPY